MGDRHSEEVGGGQAEIVSEREKAPREAKNAYEQVRRLEELIAAAVTEGHFRLRPSTLIELNRIAIDGLVTAPGRYRLGAMKIPGSKHSPPSAEEVPALVDHLCEYINDHWEQPAIHLAAYTMWRLNWIHPFQDGNGRTARASSYLVLCARLQHDLPGRDTMPAHIAGNKEPYYAALEAADVAYETGRPSLAELERLLEDTLIEQIREAATSTMDGSSPKRATSGPQALALATTSALMASKKDGWWQEKGAWIAAGSAIVTALIAAAASQCSAG